MDGAITMLQELPFLKGMKPEHIEEIAECAYNVKIPAGDFIFHEGQVANHFYIINEGRVSLETFTPGRGSMMIETLGDGHVLGWSWLFPPYRWHFDAMTLTEIKATAFDARCLRGQCETNHELGYELMKRFSQVMVERLQAARLALLDVYGRTPHTLER